MKYTVYVMLSIFSLSLLSACGWQLRGSGESANIDSAIYLEGKPDAVYANIEKTLHRKQRLVELSQADIQLVIIDERFERRAVSTDKTVNTTQYKLTLSAIYEILDKESNPLISETTAELTRYFTFDQTVVTAADKEEQSLRKEMVQQVSQQILQRVVFLSKQ